MLGCVQRRGRRGGYLTGNRMSPAGVCQKRRDWSSCWFAVESRWDARAVRTRDCGALLPGISMASLCRTASEEAHLQLADEQPTDIVSRSGGLALVRRRRELQVWGEPLIDNLPPQVPPKRLLPACILEEGHGGGWGRGEYGLLIYPAVWPVHLEWCGRRQEGRLLFHGLLSANAATCPALQF